MIIAYKDRLKDDVFKDKVGSISIKELSRPAKERRAGSLRYDEAMLLAYNKRNKATLLWSTLYSGTKITPFEGPAELLEEKVGV